MAAGECAAGPQLVERPSLSEAMIVSMPYTLTVAIIVASLWGQPGMLTVLAIGPVMAMALLIKVVITEIKDNELAAINARQAELIAALEVAGGMMSPGFLLGRTSRMPGMARAASSP